MPPTGQSSTPLRQTQLRLTRGVRRDYHALNEGEDQPPQASTSSTAATRRSKLILQLSSDTSDNEDEDQEYQTQLAEFDENELEEVEDDTQSLSLSIREDLEEGLDPETGEPFSDEDMPTRVQSMTDLPTHRPTNSYIRTDSRTPIGLHASGSRRPAAFTSSSESDDNLGSGLSNSRHQAKKRRPLTSWTYQYFKMEGIANAQWAKKGEKKLREDRLNTCLICEAQFKAKQINRVWSTTDSKRLGSPGPLQNHLVNIHNFDKDGTPPNDIKQMGPIDKYTVKDKTGDLATSIIDWIIATSRPFSVVEEPTYIRMIEAACHVVT